MAEPRDETPRTRAGAPGSERSEPPRLDEEIRSRIDRRLRARERGERSVWFGLGMFGLVGWSVAIPTIAGIAIGLYLDEHHPARFSWTLSLLGVGVLLGCLNAWYWVQQERHE